MSPWMARVRSGTGLDYKSYAYVCLLGNPNQPIVEVDGKEKKRDGERFLSYMQVC